MDRNVNSSYIRIPGVLIILAFFASSSGCQDAGMEVKPPLGEMPFPKLPDMPELWSKQEQIIPLAVGNTWKYVDSVYNQDGSRQVMFLTQQITGKTRILSGLDSIEVFILRYVEAEFDCYVRVEPDGFCRYQSDENSAPGNYDLRSMWIRYPIALGERFKTSHGDYYDSWECASTDTLIASPVARIRSLRIFDYTHGTWQKFYRPGVGLVAESSTTQLSSGQYVFRRWLISFAIH